MKLSSIESAELSALIASEGVRIRIGPFIAHLTSPFASVADGIGLLYADHELDNEPFSDFHIRVMPPEGIRRWFRPQALFYFDNEVPFKPLPVSQALPFFEWGLNWCIARHANQYMILHAAVIEQRGRAVVMPAPPGSGKSTLCAGLVSRGWRLLSDELAMLTRSDGFLAPIPRPISLKNESIAVIRRFAQDTIIGPECADTAKGTVAHMRAPVDSVERVGELATPRWFVLPRYVKDAKAELSPMTKGKMFMHVVQNAFNYHVHGKEGFTLLADVIDRCDCFEFSYGSLEDAIPIFDELSSVI